MRVKSPKTIALGLALTATLLLYLLSRIDLGHMVDMLNELPPRSLLAALAIYVFLNACLAVRFQLLLNATTIPINRLLAITGCHNLLAQSLPFRAGEVCYVGMLNRYLGRPVADGVTSLVGARLFELNFTLLGGLVGLIAMGWHVDGHGKTIAISLLPALVVGLTGAYYAGGVCRYLSKLLGCTSGLRRWRAKDAIARLAETLNDMGSQLDGFRSGQRFGGTTK